MCCSFEAETKMERLVADKGVGMTPTNYYRSRPDERCLKALQKAFSINQNRTQQSRCTFSAPH